MTSSLASVSYKSRASAGVVDQRTLDDMLVFAQAQNVHNGLTGAMAYGEGHFVQVLEGPEAPLHATVARIRADARHHSLEFVGPMPIAHRRFPDWCMASLTHEPGLKPVLALLMADWNTYGPEAAELLAGVLNDEPAEVGLSAGVEVAGKGGEQNDHAAYE